MATAGTGRHNRLCTILVKVGTPVSKALFEKRVKDLRPLDHDPTTWTVSQFLQTNKKKIISKVGRNKKTIIYSIGSDVARLEHWDLYLVTSILLEFCELDPNIKLFISQLRKLRNKLFHLSEPTIDDDKYEHYLTKLKVIFDKCLMEIQDEKFSEETKEMIKTLEEGSLQQNDIDDVMNKLRLMQEETNDKLSMLGQGQHVTNGKIDLVLEKLQLLTANMPALNTLPVPDSEVKVAINKCTKEKESDISKVLVDSFTDMIKRDPLLHKELSEISNESQQKIKDAVYQTYELFLSSGCTIVDAEEGCVRLTLKWTSLTSMIKFNQDCMAGKLTERLHVLTEAVRMLNGCEDVTLTVVIDVDAFSVTANALVTMIEEFFATETRPIQPSTSEAAGNMNICKGDTVEKEDRDSSGLRLRIRSDHLLNMVKLKNLFDCGDVDFAFKHLQEVVRSELETPDMLITAHLIQRCSLNENGESFNSADGHRTAELTEDKQTGIQLQEENADFARKIKQDIKLGTEYGIDNWLNEERHSSLEKPDLVIALDVGNYASGFVIQTRSDFLDDPQKIICNTKWPTSGLHTYKTPTCLLLNPDKSIADFGYHAESRFNQLGIEDDDENPKDWYFFKHFKRVLYQEENVDDDTPVMGAYGKTLPVLDVFSKTIEYLKVQAIDCLNQNGVPCSDVDTKWVITVPGTCSEPAKLVMKHAAEKAGINGANLSIALEPECAAIYCSQLPVDQLEIQDDSGNRKNVAAPDSTIMVVDLGGGTVNITTVQRNKDSTLKQVNVSGGGHWGGMKIDESFMKMLTEIVGCGAMESFVEKFPMDEYELRMEFESRKREVKHFSETKDDERVLIKLPQTLQDLCEESQGRKMSDILADEGPYQSVKFVHGRLSFHPDVIHNFFDGVVKNILDYIGDEMKAGVHIDSVILAGGFAQSNRVVQNLREGLKEFEIPVLRLESPELAILNGAAIFGHNEGIISSRIMPYTYGVAMIMEYDRLRHNVDEAFTTDGKIWANNVFQKYVTKGQEVKRRDVVVAKEYFTADEEQKSATVFVYSSDKKDPIHVTESGCRCIGSIEIDELATECDPDMEVEPWSRRRVVEVAMSFAGLDVKIKAISKILGNVYQKYIRIK